VAFDFGSLLSSKTPPMVGLDISTTSVKLVELTEAGKGNFKLARYSIEPLPKGAVVDGNIENMEAVSDAIRAVWRRSGTRIKNVAMALPSAAVITKRIFLPDGLTDEAMELQVETEANQYIPFALDEVSLDFQALGPAASSPGDVEVLIAASRKEKVEDRVAAAQSAGLKPVVMDIESYATRASVERLRNMLPNGGENMIVAIFNIGANATSISVMLNGQSIYEREQAFGGSQLTQDISRTFALPFEEAESKKRSMDLPENYTRDVLQPFIENVALEVTRALQFFFTSTPYGRVDQIMLGGGCAVIDGLADVVANRSQTPTSIINPFKGMEIDSDIREKQLRLDAPALLTVTGLAMRRFVA
jgi:type IV pilus assembly protein PilM